MELTVLTSSITEPVTKTEVKTFMGYPAAETSQDSLIDSMITAARVFLENKTGLSIVSKSYKAYFEQWDAEDGWYELPVSPVLASPAITVSVSGVSTTFQQRGSKIIRILPDSVFGTIAVGASSVPPYVEVTFQAGATDVTANECVKRITAHLFNHRDDGIGLNMASLPFDTQRLIQSITVV